jgi:peptidase M28-like protein
VVEDERFLFSVIDSLAGIPRLPTSPGEHRAAALIRDDLARAGCRATVEAERAYSSYAVPIGLLCAASVIAGGAAARGHRPAAAVVAGLAALGIADDVSGWRMAFRRWFLTPRTAHNVVAVTGDETAATTLVVLAHHDAAPSGVAFDQRVHHWVQRRWPALIEAARSNPPLWWPVIAGPALVSLGSATGTAALRRTGMVLSLGSLAAMVDIGRRPAVPGANDNLSGVAVLIALAHALRERPVPGLRVLLVSAGAEEALQEGIRGFARRHFAGLPRERTWFLNLDTVGSGRLVLLEGEGPVRMLDYDRRFRDLVAGCAAEQGIPLLRGLRSRNSTDGVVPARHGYPTATLVSVDRHKLMPHYHLDSDRPSTVDLGSVARAGRLAEAVARKLAGQALL